MARLGSRQSIDVTLLTGGALVAGGLVPVAPVETLCGAVAALTLLRLARRARPAVLALTSVALLVGAARAAGAIDRWRSAAERADAALPQPARCSFRAEVSSSPVETHDVLRWDARVGAVHCDGSDVPWTGVATLYGGPPSLARGDAVDVVASLAAPERFWNEADGDPGARLAHRGVDRTGGTLDVRVVHRARGILATIDVLRALVRARIDATFPADLAPMARALVLGETDLAPADDRAFRASGLSHLLAVSGMHLILVLGATLRAIEAALVRVPPLAARLDVKRWSAAAGVPAAWLYAEFAGAGGSTLRAAWMMSIALAARATGRRSDGPRAFGLSVLVMGAVDPLVVHDVSFLLSAGATAGLLAFARPFGAALGVGGDESPRVLRRVRDHVAQAIATTLAATMPCAPILARFAPAFPLGGVVANLLAVPVGESAALPLCLVHAAMRFWPAAERGCAAAASGALVLVRTIARLSSVDALEAAVPRPTSWQLTVVALWWLSLAMRLPRRRAAAAIALAALSFLERVARDAGAPRGELRATFLDVGQGDAALIDLPNGEALLIDAGGFVGSPIDVGERVIAPELRARRRDRLALVVLTHPHPDHFGGLAAGLGGVQVGDFWDTGEGELEGVTGGYAAWLAEARGRGVHVERPASFCGRREVGGAQVEVLAPCPDFTSDRNPNDNSVVLRITYGRRAFLFVGDAEQEEESDLLEHDRPMLRADVLKVGHHGSRTSSSAEFLAAVGPTAAVISAGRRNRFGHPSPVTLAALAAAGVTAWRTDRDGSVIARTDGRSLSIVALAHR